MQTFLFFHRAGEPAPAIDDLAAVLARTGVECAGTGPYRPGRWRQPATGATCLCDLGEPPLEEDLEHPPRSYAGWLPVPLSLHVPLAGPHWLAVECFGLVEAVLAALPGLAALDTEDIAVPGADEAGPAAWDRPRAIISWERLAGTRAEGLAGLPRMGRASSVRLWRYRRERAAAAAADPAARWPEALVLHDQATGAAVSAALWPDGDAPAAIPPVELLVASSSSGPRLLPASAAAAGGTAAAAGASRVANARAAVVGLDAGLPAVRFRALGDHDWGD